MDIRIFVSLIIILTTGVFQAEISQDLNKSISKYYDESFINILISADYIFSIFTPISIWIVFTLSVHMVAIIIGKEGKIRDLFSITGVSFLPFMINLLIMYLVINTSNNDFGNEMINLINDPNYDIKLNENIHLSLFRKISTVSTVMFFIIYLLLIKKAYNQTYINALVCVTAPIICYIFIYSILF